MVQTDCNIIVIGGPTGIGKSKVAVEVAKQLNGEIISCDSMQIYKGLNIGTAKITADDMQGIPHYMVDCINPDVSFSAGEYANAVKPIIKKIHNSGKIVILTGGTAFYIRALLYGINAQCQVKNDSARQFYNNLLTQHGSEYLFTLLQKKDPSRAQALHPNDSTRVIRALEILETSNSISPNPIIASVQHAMFVLTCDRKDLYAAIDKRVLNMFANGLVDEVKELVNSGISRSSQSMKAIGYKEIFDYLDGELDYNDVISLIQKNSRNYAKRQMTFFRSFQAAHSVDRLDAATSILAIIKAGLKKDNNG